MDIKYEDHSGTDLSVVNAAKVSFAKRSTSIGQREINLIRFLARGYSSDEWDNIVKSLVESNDYEFVSDILLMVKKNAVHWTPFTHTSITMVATAPVPIRTQMFKHKVGFTENEESRRYINSRPKFFIPTEWREAAFDKKQGSGGRHPESDIITEDYKLHCEAAIEKYLYRVSHLWQSKTTGDTFRDVDDLRSNPDLKLVQMGVASEQARFYLPQGCEVQWFWTGNLASYARVYNQRTDAHAQLEIQEMAHEISKIIAPLFPHSWDALTGQ